MQTETPNASERQLGPLLTEAVFSVFHALEQHLAPMLAELDLTESLADALWQLDPAHGPVPRRALAERLRCDPSNVTFLVDRLEERGLVERSADLTDRRVKAISLTSAGIATRERLLAGTASAPLFARLSTNQQRQLAHLLTRCLGH